MSATRPTEGNDDLLRPSMEAPAPRMLPDAPGRFLSRQAPLGWLPRLRRYAPALAWVGIVALGLGLRIYHLDQNPAHGDTADEYAWAWSGMTLWSEGSPTAWSWLDGYGNFPVVQWRGGPVKLVRPWMDHPPLYSLFVGAWMHLWGTHRIFDVDLYLMRWSGMPLFLLSCAALTWVLRAQIPVATLLLALLLFGTAPPAVLQHRLVISENFWLPLWVGTYGAMLAFLRRPRHIWLATVVLGCSLLPLSKVAALSGSLFLLVVSLRRASARLAWAVMGGTLLGLLVYLLYGWLVGGETFFRVLATQSRRFEGLGAFFALLFDPGGPYSSFHYLPFMVGLVWCIGLAARSRAPEWVLPVLCYAGGMAFFVGERTVYGWYSIPLFPWLVTAVADMVTRAWKARTPSAAWVLFLFLWTGALSVLFEEGNLSRESLRYVYLSGLLLGTGLLWTPRVGRMMTRPLMASLVACTVATNIYWVWRH